MHESEAGALRQLAVRDDEWPVDELRKAIDADMLRRLDGEGAVDVCRVKWVQPPGAYFNDPRPLVQERGEWFSPIERRIAWAEILSAPPLGAPKLGDWSYLIRASDLGRLGLVRYDGASQQPAEGEDRFEPARATGTESAVHSSDFTSLNWFGARYEFNKTQAECVKLLWSEWKKGELGLSEKTIADAIGSSADQYRLAHTFRVRAGGQHPAWGTMIRPFGKGIFRLSAPNHE